MSQSPMSPVGKRLRTMSSDSSSGGGGTSSSSSGSSSSTDSPGSSSSTNTNVNSPPDGERLLNCLNLVRNTNAYRNNSDNHTNLEDTPATPGLDVVGSQPSEHEPGTSSGSSAPNSSSNASSAGSIPLTLFYPPILQSTREQVAEQITIHVRNRNTATSRNISLDNNRHHHHDEVVDERIPAAAHPREPVVGEPPLRLPRRTARNRDRNEANQLVLFVRAPSADSDRSSVYQGFRAPMFNDFDIEGDSYDLSTDEDAEEVNNCLPEEYLKYDPTPNTPYPRPNWITINELRARKCGFASARQPMRRPDMYWFRRYASSSLWMIQRLQLERTLKSHTGCVNSLGFNSSGSLLCSGSDDLFVCVWDWQKRSNQLLAKINSGHTSNVFQSLFCKSDSNIVTSSLDGSVRLLDLETKHTRPLLATSGAISKLSFLEPNKFVTCGSDANVNVIDLRTEKSRKLFTVRNPDNGRRCELHSIDSHPIDKNIIAVAGSSPYVFLYDLRRLPRDTFEREMKQQSCLGHEDVKNHIVTSAAFNSTGDKLLVSYNPDDLYVYKTDSCELLHKYRGHRNQNTIKGCSWFGENYVLSGSDDGHIYGWDLESEHIVFFQSGDRGVVNTLCVHPSLPVLASSGLESDVKVWEPISSTWPQTMKGIKPQICKNTLRRKRELSREDPNGNDDDYNDFDEDGDDEDDEDEEDMDGMAEEEDDDDYEEIDLEDEENDAGDDDDDDDLMSDTGSPQSSVWGVPHTNIGFRTNSDSDEPSHDGSLKM